MKSANLSWLNEVSFDSLVGEVLTEQATKRDVSMYSDIFADAVAVAMSKIEEKMGDKFESARDAEQFTHSMLMHMRTKGRPDITKRLRKFDRQGSKRTARDFKRSL